MQFLDRFSIKERMIYTFLFIGVMLAVFGALNVDQVQELGKLTATLYEHPLRVSKAALSAQVGIYRMQRDMKIVVGTSDEFEQGAAIRDIQLEEARVIEELNTIQKFILEKEGQQLARETRAAFDAWRPVRLKVETLITEGKQEQASLVTKTEVAARVKELDIKIQEITAYAQNKADTFVAYAIDILDSVTVNTLITLLVIFTILFLLAYTLIRHLLFRMGELQATLSAISTTGTLTEAKIIGHNEISELAASFNLLIQSLKKQFWLREGVSTLNDKLARIQSIAETCETAINLTARHMGACAGAIFLHDSVTCNNTMLSSYSREEGALLAKHYADGEGIVGQVARDMQAILLSAVHYSDALMTSGTMHAIPQEILVVPLIYDTKLIGIMELASLTNIDAIKREFVDMVAHQIAISMSNALQREHIERLFAETQATNRSLEERGSELGIANDQLATRNEELRAQSEELKMQAEELKNMTEELTQQKGELDTKRIQVEEADRLKSEFLSNMSHELRTPLNSILALSQLMLTKGTGLNTDKDSEYLGVIERNGRHLLSLINDILDLSKIEAGRMDIFTSTFVPAELVEETLETIRPLADRKGISLTFTHDMTQPFVSDSDKVRQIVLNLISNAVKFTDTGGVAVTLREQPEKLTLAVTDTGIGIEHKDLSIIFDEFRQVDGSTTRKHDGTGLGLAICKKLALLLGGDLHVESAPGEGSTFTLELPLSQAETAKKLKTEQARHTTNLHNSPTVLVVDDEEQTRQLLSEYLLSAGYDVIEADNGVTALELAMEYPLHAILLDISMPKMDGWEVLRQLKMSPKTLTIPVIIISISDDRTTGMALGATGYFVKPVNRSMLIHELKRLEASQKVQTVLIVDDDSVFRDQVAAILHDAGYTPFEAGSGELALDVANRLRPDVMLLDLMMPEMDGFQVLDRIAAEPALSYLPVFVVTAKDLTAQEKSALMKRSKTIVQKGSRSINELLHTIEKSLRAIRVVPQLNPMSCASSNILVVEDNEIAAMQISTALEEIGCTVHNAADGDEAIQYLTEDIPDAIILDLMMPGIDGFDLLETLRSKPETSLLPVVVVTAKELTSEDRARLSNNNISQLVRKGTLNRNQLKEVVLNVLASRSAHEHQAPSLPKTHARIAEHVAASGRTVLIVEDNEDNLLTLQAVLQDFDGTLLIARDGERGVAMAQEHHPDIILMDIQLPGMSGLEATRIIKAEKRLADIPVIALTARAMQREKEEVFSAGCNDILLKPYDPEQLWSILSKWLSA